LIEVPGKRKYRGIYRGVLGIWAWDCTLYRAGKTDRLAEYPEEEPSRSGCRRGCGTDIGEQNGFLRQFQASWSESPYVHRTRASIGGRMSNMCIRSYIVSRGSAVCQVVFSHSAGGMSLSSFFLKF